MHAAEGSCPATDSHGGTKDDGLDDRGDELLDFELLDEDYPFKGLLTTNKRPTAEEERKVQRRIRASQKRVVAVQREIWRLERLIEDLQYDEEEEERRTASYRRILAPIKKLPDEILGQIFQHLHSFERGLPLSVSLVCSLWRQVILDTPQLWTTIRLTPSDSGLEFSEVCLERCGPSLPIDVRIEEWSQPGGCTLELDWLEAHRHRIRRLSVMVSSKSVHCIYRPDTWIPSIPGDGFDSLEELELNLHCTDWGCVKFALWRPSTKLDSLRRLYLTNIGLPPPEIPIPFAQLTHLTLDSPYTEPTWDLRDALQFLSSLLNLQSIKIANFTKGYEHAIFEENEFTRHTRGPRSRPSRLPPPQYPSAESERVTLPNLVSLSIDFGDGTGWFIDRLTTPALRSLALKKAASWVRSFKGLVERSQCTLVNLSMSRCRPDGGSSYLSGQDHVYSRYNEYDYETEERTSAYREDQVVNALKLAPTIRELRVVDSMFLGNHLVTMLSWPADTEPLLGPNLRHLAVSDTKVIKNRRSYQADESDILRMLASRKPGGRQRKRSAMPEFTLYHSGNPYIPADRMPFGYLFEEYGTKDYEISTHIFF